MIIFKQLNPAIGQLLLRIFFECLIFLWLYRVIYLLYIYYKHIIHLIEIVKII